MIVHSKSELRFMMLNSLPAFLVMLALQPFFPTTHPWKGRHFTLREWAIGCTPLCLVLSVCLWMCLPSAVLLIYLVATT